MFLTLWKHCLMFPLNFLPLFLQLSFLWNVICGTSYLCSLKSLSYKDVIYGTSTICLVAYTIVGIACGSTLSLIIFCALTFLLSYSLFILEHKAPIFSTLFFLSKSFLGKFDVAFFLFSNVVCISSLVHLTLVGGFCGFSFWCTNKYQSRQTCIFLISFIVLDIFIPLI